MPQKHISLTKQKHEVSGYPRHLKIRLYTFAAEVGAMVHAPSFTVSNRGVGEAYLPSRDIFEKLTPQSDPAGLIFRDGSFFVFQEVPRYEVNEMTLDKTLRLILINFPTMRI